MAFENITLAGYLSDPDSFAVMPDIPPEVLKSIYKMLSPLYAPVCVKIRMISEVRDTIVNEGITAHFDTKLLKTLKPTAYMRDGGGVYFSLGLLAMKSPLATLPVCLHEFSHIILSRMEGYSVLKALERQFRTEYGTHPECNIASPIELYADLMTEYILTRAYEGADSEKKRKCLLRALSQRQKKILAARETLSNLAPKNE